MTIFVTGAAGFIGYHMCEALLARGNSVFGIDNLNDYYDVALKKARLARLQQHGGFKFALVDICDVDGLNHAVADAGDVRAVLHLAAQAGVRYSLINPAAYVNTNIVGQLNILEICRQLPNLEHMVYASSSSVYGGSTALPFSESDPVNSPVSLYAASKKADELMGHVYAHLYRIPLTGLRFFTVYGPWGRPDMAAYIFTRAIFSGEPIKIFNNGDMRRDFTFVDDVVQGVLTVLDAPPSGAGVSAPHRIYNIGNNRSEPLLRYVELLEKAIGRSAQKELAPMQPGDVKETYADIDAIRRDHGFEPKTSIDEGIPRFVAWYRGYHGV
ncbi:MAG: GDP-mannose 4,6-dehydratase [Proteobacteria bacterium]|nr:GDP-mannose 4,6-dehydratase [Pseudomonadota bacterium]MDA1355616.1 GDP-mannose 4,6-dehydratase [Pseudomonadota bacterium]